MRRITKQRIINIVLIMTSTILYVWNLLYRYTDIFLFGVMLIFATVGVARMYRYIIFKSDSSLWLGITFVSVAITYIIMVFLRINLDTFYPLFLISPIIGSIFVGLIFKDVLQLKVILYITNYMGFSMLHTTNHIEFWQTILFSIIVGIVITMVVNILPRIYSRKK